jgi:hypothetical protein
MKSEVVEAGPRRVFLLGCCLAVALFQLPVEAEVQFVDATTDAGIAFRHQNGAKGEKHYPEIQGSGAVFFDYDADGWLDLYFANTAGPGALYRNRGDGRFEETTATAGAADSGQGMGCIAADYDRDGDLDLYITCYGPNILYRNNGDGSFTDVTSRSGVGDPGFGAGAAFADYDQDGDLDLYVANYVEYPPAVNPPCIQAKGMQVYCGPDAYAPQADVFFGNAGDGTFTDISEAVGLRPRAAKELAAVFSDYDRDGDVDLYVAGDRTANLLYRNDGDRFVEVGLLAGVAFDNAGEALAGMGLAVADYDHNGFFDFFVTNYQWETNSLYRNLGNGFFADATYEAGLGMPSLRHLAWGTIFFDYDNDGDADLFVANGHLDDNVELFDTSVTYAQQNQLFRNDGQGRFTDVTQSAGPGMALAQVSRGAAVGDYDEDGDLDLVVANNNQPAALLRNDGGNLNRWLSVKLIGGASNRDGIGALVEVVAEGRSQIDEVRSGSSFLSQNDLRLHFGLGAAENVELVKIRWPGGIVEELTGVEANQVLTVSEPVR